MTIAVDKQYYELVKAFPLLHIQDDKHLAQAQEMVLKLARKQATGKATRAEEAYFQALTDLVIAYESKRFTFDELTPQQRLRYLMDENGLTQQDLAPIFGSHSHVSEFLNNKRSLSKKQIAGLASRFMLSPAAFFSVD